MRENSIGQWMHENAELLGVLLVSAMFLVFLYGMAQTAVRGEQMRVQQANEQVAQCMRLFDYTHDQCAFIVNNHTMIQK